MNQNKTMSKTVKHIRPLLLILIMCLIVNTLFSQSRILYVTPDYQTGPVYDKIRTSLIKGLRDKLEKEWIREISSTTWERIPNKKKLLEDNRVNYVLKLDKLPVIKGTDRVVNISFSFIFVDQAYQIHDVMWYNSDFTLDLNASKDPININKVVSNVYEEIDYFIHSSDDPWERKFRPRIKIDGFELSTTEITDIDFNAFRKWLNNVLRDQYAVDPKYVFYYSRKYDKQYPDNSVYQISGTFSKAADADDKLVKVQLIIEFPDAYDVKPTVISSTEFNMDDKRKDELIKSITNVLENDINYYGVE